MDAIRISMTFTGAYADENLLDFYDAAVAFSAFQRSLALTAHLVINGEIITQAPSLRGARILSEPIEPGSWKTVGVVVGTVALAGGAASKDSVLGNLFTSAYDYVINEALGFHVDFEKTLGVQISEMRKKTDAVPKELDQGKFYSLIEKSETAIKDLHRPIYKSRTATESNIKIENYHSSTPIGPTLNIETFDYIDVTRLTDISHVINGKISSYNTNTYKGRIYVENEGRTIPFTLSDNCRAQSDVLKVVNSLASNAIDIFDNAAHLRMEVLRFESKSGFLKAFLVVNII